MNDETSMPSMRDALMIVKYFCPVCERVVDITELEGAAVWHLGHGYDERIRCASCAAWLKPTPGWEVSSTEPPNESLAHS